MFLVALLVALLSALRWIQVKPPRGPASIWRELMVQDVGRVERVRR